MRRLFGSFALLLLASGCVVRTQDFHCLLREDPKTNFELRMSPTSVEARDVSYSFDAETGAERTYKNESSGQTLRFNPASGQLYLSVTPDLVWFCERYSPY